ncbi:5'/3'-nucleotidase SurE [Saliphagus sp. GCM10025308]
MSARPAVLLTNDDGIDATGIRALYDALEPVADVTVVAPATDRSGMSRSDSNAFTVEERAEGYAVDGTPVDCVHFARGKLEREFDVVVSGCNDSPNLGAHKIERSGTVCAAIEAGFLGLPGIALSLYDSVTGSREFGRDEYADAERITRYLVRETLGSAIGGRSTTSTSTCPPASPTRGSGSRSRPTTSTCGSTSDRTAPTAPGITSTTHWIPAWTSI